MSTIPTNFKTGKAEWLGGEDLPCDHHPANFTASMELRRISIEKRFLGFENEGRVVLPKRRSRKTEGEIPDCV